jgi:spore coat polysaccharide biosynthesis protein SpsF (cytidylyltransferase family)
MNNLKILPVILSRLGSGRLPAKSLLLIRPKTSILENIILQLNILENVERPVLATSNYKEDDVLDYYANQLGIKVLRGSHDNVIGRLHMAAIKEGADYVLRVNSDSIIVDRELIDIGISKLHRNNYDYVTNLRPRSYPYGISLQIISTELLSLCIKSKLDNKEKEHITPAIDKYINPSRLYNISSPLSFDYSNKRLVVDTVDDYVRMFRLFFNKNIAKPEYSWQRDSSLLEYLKVV